MEQRFFTHRYNTHICIPITSRDDKSFQFCRSIDNIVRICHLFFYSKWTNCAEISYSDQAELPETIFAEKQTQKS